MTRIIDQIWNEAEPTLGISRFHRALDCWLFSCAQDVPDYMQLEYECGRVLICTAFTENRYRSQYD